jgi:hypothetical protein
MVMGYRTSSRLPFIAEQPSKKGLYFSLYQKALETIGCTLTVRRAPKKRILKMITDGEVDFYPGLGYSPKREKDFHYFENGFMSHTVAISHKDTPDIHQLSDMEGKVLLTAIGGNQSFINSYNIYLRQIHDLSTDIAINLLADKRADFYLFNKASILYYLKLNPNQSIKIHPCCFEPSAMYLGFSKKSKYALTINNPDFSSLEKNSVTNTQHALDPKSKAFAFKTALQKLKEDGTVAQLESIYYQ